MVGCIRGTMTAGPMCRRPPNPGMAMVERTIGQRLVEIEILTQEVAAAAAAVDASLGPLIELEECYELLQSVRSIKNRLRRLSDCSIPAGDGEEATQGRPRAEWPPGAQGTAAGLRADQGPPRD